MQIRENKKKLRKISAREFTKDDFRQIPFYAVFQQQILVGLVYFEQ
jgi:hypothetical protein